MEESKQNKEVKGLGGWLIIVGIGVVLNPIIIALKYVPLFYSIFTNGTFQVLTTPGTEAYHQFWGPLLIFEAVGNSFFLLASVFLIYLFFSKNYLFPVVYIALILTSLIFIPLDAWLASFVITDEPMFDPATIKEFSRVLIATVIWVPYLLKSKRVKATFN